MLASLMIAVAVCAGSPADAQDASAPAAESTPPAEVAAPRPAEVAAPPSTAELQAKLSASEARVAELERALHGGDAKAEGLVPHLLFGPKLSVIGLPTPGVGLEAKAFGYVGASFDYGFLPTLTVKDVTVRLTSWKLGAKVYPFHGAFLVGAALGRYTFRGSSTGTSPDGTSIRATATVTSTFLEPHVGWRWIGSSGFFTAIDLGWAFPLNYSSRTDAPAGTTGNVKDIEDNADKYLKSGMPSLALLQLGWFL